MVSKTKDSIGSILSGVRLTRDDALMQVGFKPGDSSDPVVAGSHLMAVGDPANAAHDQGYITSAAIHRLGSSIGIGFLKNGATRKGEIIRAMNPVEGSEVLVEVVSAHFVDPEGERLRA